MSKNRKTNWLGIILSLILATVILAACGADIPDDIAPTEPANTETVTQADGDNSESTEIVSELNEVFSEPSESSAPSNDTPDAMPADDTVDTNGVPVGFTENGNPYRGNPNAPVVIEEFSDFQ